MTTHGLSQGPSQDGSNEGGVQFGPTITAEVLECVMLFGLQRGAVSILGLYPALRVANGCEVLKTADGTQTPKTCSGDCCGVFIIVQTIGYFFLLVSMTMSKSVCVPKHINYCYSFGESFSRRAIKVFDKIQLTKCQSTEDRILVDGGQDHCTFVLKQEVGYAARCTNQYQTPTVKKAAKQLVVAKEFISTENLNALLFNFTIHMDVEDTGYLTKGLLLTSAK